MTLRVARSSRVDRRVVLLAAGVYPAPARGRGGADQGGAGKGGAVGGERDAEGGGGNLKQAAADKPKRMNPFAAEDRPRRTNPFAPVEETPKRKTNPFAAEAGAWINAAESTVESVAENAEENAEENVEENAAENVEMGAEEAETRVSVTRPPRRQPLLRKTPRAPRAPKAPKAPKAKPEAKPDAWAMPAEKEAALRRQYASLCDGDNGVNVATLQEECENLGLDEATGHDM